MSTNDIMGDDRLPNKQWMQDNGLHSFAGYPLKFRWELLSVIAMFGRRPWPPAESHVFCWIADGTANEHGATTGGSNPTHRTNIPPALWRSLGGLA